jgi:hypothetical protein
MTEEDFEYIRELRSEGYKWPEVSRLLNMQEGEMRRQFMAWLKEQRGGNEHNRTTS